MVTARQAATSLNAGVVWRLGFGGMGPAKENLSGGILFSLVLSWRHAQSQRNSPTESSLNLAEVS